MKVSGCGLLAVAAALLFTASAQEAVAQDTVVVTATRMPVSIDDQPYTIKVLGEPELKASESLADALVGLPDVYVQMPGGRTGFSSLFLRGADPNFTSVLLEGVPLSSPTNSRGGAVNVAAIPAMALGGAELVAGPASTLYGSGALAGVLNLLLPAPTERPRLTIGGSAGSEGDYSGLARWQGPLTSGWGAALGAVWDEAGTALPQSGFRSRSVDILVASRGEHRNRLVAHWADTSSHAFPDSSGGADFAEIRDPERRSSDEAVFAFDRTVGRAGSTTFSLAGSYFWRRDRADSPGVAPSMFSPGGVPAGQDDTRYRAVILRPSVHLALAQWHATLGLVGQWERARSEGFLDLGSPVPASFTGERATQSAYVDLGGAMGPFSLDAGLRIDDIDQIGNRVTGRVGVRASLRPDLIVRASVGTAFKAPSFYALSNPFVGNPALKAESGKSAEIGFEQALGRQGSLSIVLFRSRYRNLIDFVPGEIPRLENRALVGVKGVSASLDYRPAPGLSVALSAQYATSRNLAGEGALLHRPKWRANALLNWQVAPDLDVRAQYSLTDRRLDFAIPTGIQILDATHRGSVSIAWRPTRDAEIRLSGENLFDDRGGDAIGFPALPARARLAVTRRF